MVIVQNVEKLVLCLNEMSWLLSLYLLKRIRKLGVLINRPFLNDDEFLKVLSTFDSISVLKRFTLLGDVDGFFLDVPWFLGISEKGCITKKEAI